MDVLTEPSAVDHAARGAGVELTLVLPLRAKDSISLEEFYSYWLNVHVTLPPRFPGISSVWLHVVSFDRQLWPSLPGVSGRPAPEDEFHGVPEAEFPTFDDLAQFQKYSDLQMEDGINFLQEQIAYRSMGGNSATVVDRLDDPAPDGRDGLLRHLVFLRRRSDVSVEQLRQFVEQRLMATYAKSPVVLKLRHHLFEEVELTLDHPGVGMFKPLERQYQAAFEIVVADEDALTEFTQSPSWLDTAEQLAAHCAAVHGVRVDRCITTKLDGKITLAGVRGVDVADTIAAMGADNQRNPAVSQMFLSSPSSK